MDHENLRVLLQIVDSGSIQGAARALNVSRSLLRRRLDLLEAEVGVPLLHRNATGVQLTASGSIVAQQGRFVLESAQTLLADARAAANTATGIIRVIEPIGLPVTTHVRILLATHAAVPTPKIIVRPAEDPLAHLHEPCELMLHDGRIPEKGTWFSRIIVRQQLRALASPAYLETRGRPSRISDLAHHDILGWKRPRQPVDEWPLVNGGTVKVSPWYVSPDFFLLQTLASRGGGIVLAPKSPLIDEAEADRLVPVLENQIGTELVFRASSPNPTHADSRTRAVLEQIHARLKDFPADEG
ncbi:MAG TPA: LysR family transcriptional regulator [Polyangium sp.]|nr:LysR family transcriptional regulator [Polyangium sp.]